MSRALRTVVIAFAVAVAGCGSPGDTKATDLAAPIEDATALTDATRPPPDLAMRPALVSPAEATDTDPAPDIVHIRLTAARHRFDVHDTSVDGFAYNGQVPGPTIRARLGDRLIVDLDNQLPVATTIHWHGLKVPYSMDGVTWQHAPIAAGARFQYTFQLTQAGTFWYHPHFDSSEQVDRGLYGVLVVEDPAEPRTDAELILVLDAFGEGRAEADGGAPSEGDAGVTADGGAAHGGGGAHQDRARLWTVNRQHMPLARLTGGQTVRVRLLNASTGGYVDLRQPAMRQIASDQGLLPKLRLPSSLVLAPGDRAELEWLVGSDGFMIENAPYSAQGGAAVGAPEELLSVAVDRPAAAPSGRSWAFSGRAPSADPPYSDIVWVLQGEGDRWFINGELFPDVTIERLAYGANAIIEVRNLSASEHPFHLHGYAFEVLSAGGKRALDYTLEDTINVPTYGTVRLRLRADNPGDWMAHCHILSHAEGGMMTILRVDSP